MTEYPDDAAGRLNNLLELFRAGQYRACVELADLMTSANQVHPIQAIILAVAAELSDDAAAYRRGVEVVGFVLENQPSAADSMRRFDRLVCADLVRGWLAQGRFAPILWHLGLAQRYDPIVAGVFGDDLGASGVSVAQAKIPDQTPGLPIASFTASPGTPPLRRALVLGRKFFFGPNSRLHDIGPRMARGLTLGGWISECVDPGFDGVTPVPLSPDLLVRCCVDFGADIVLIDHFGFRLSVADWGTFTDRLRQTLPGVRVVHLNFDPWIAENWPLLAALGAQTDLVWSHFPAGEYWDQTGLRHKLAYHPFPIGVDLSELPRADRLDKTIFQGAVEGYNYHRAYWLAMFDKAGIKVERRVTAHVDDRLDPIESYRRYLAGFTTAQRLLSFSMRSDGSRIVTGRSFETIYSGGCLIQERADDLESFFTPGVHFFRFETFAELRDLLAYLEKNPDLAGRVAKAGQDYYLAHYSDRHLVAYLNNALYPDG